MYSFGRSAWGDIATTHMHIHLHTYIHTYVHTYIQRLQAMNSVGKSAWGDIATILPPPEASKLRIDQVNLCVCVYVSR